MRSERVRESRRVGIFEAETAYVSAETSANAGRKPNSVAIAVFIPGFSDLP
jgi:hypothetical protein